MIEWHRVENELPGFMQSVLWITKNKEYFIGSLRDIDGDVITVGIEGKRCYIDISKVTHWSNLPLLPNP